MDLIIFLLDMFLTPRERPSFYALLIAVAGLLMVVGLRKASISLIVTAVVLMVTGSPAFESLVDSLIDQLPDWAFWPLMAVLAFSFLRWVLVRVLGEEKGREAIAAAFTWLLRNTLLFPFRVIGFLWSLGPAGRWLLVILFGGGGVWGYLRFAR